MKPRSKRALKILGIGVLGGVVMTGAMLRHLLPPNSVLNTILDAMFFIMPAVMFFTGTLFAAMFLWKRRKSLKATAARFFKGLGKIIVYALLAALVIGVLSLVVWGWIILIAAGPVVVFLALIWTTMLLKD